MAKRVDARQEIRGLHEDLETVRSEVGGLVKSLTDLTPDKVKELTSAVSSAADAASERVKALASYAGEQGSAGKDTVESTIRSYPWLSVVFALLLGFGLGRLTDHD